MAFEDSPPVYVVITGQPKTGKSTALALIRHILMDAGAAVELADDQTTRDSMDVALSDLPLMSEATMRIAGKRVILRVADLKRE